MGGVVPGPWDPDGDGEFLKGWKRKRDLGGPMGGGGEGMGGYGYGGYRYVLGNGKVLDDFRGEGMFWLGSFYPIFP